MNLVKQCLNSLVELKFIKLLFNLSHTLMSKGKNVLLNDSGLLKIKLSVIILADLIEY